MLLTPSHEEVTMKRSYLMLFVAFFFVGCSGAASQVEVQTPHEHQPANSLRPGNGVGNSLVLPEVYQGLGEDTRRASLPTSTESTGTTDWIANATPFSSSSSVDGALQDSSVSTGQALGLDIASDDPTESSTVDLPAAPAAVIEPSSPSWSEIASTPEPVVPPAPTSQLTSEQVFRAAEALPGLSSWTVVPFAHFRRELQHVVVAWPAMNSAGEVVDATVVGICLEESENGDLEQCGSRWVINDQATARAALLRALGGTDYEVVTGQVGTPLDDLGPRLSQLGTTFASAAADGDRDEAQRAAAAFAQMLPAEQIAFDNELAQLLWAAAHYDGRLDHVSTERGDRLATLNFDVNRGWARVQTIRVLAQAVEGDPSRWVVVDYR